MNSIDLKNTFFFLLLEAGTKAWQLSYLAVLNSRLCVVHPYLDEVHQQRVLEHPVQLDVLVEGQVLQAAPGGVLCHRGEHAVHVEEGEEGVDVLMMQVFQLEGEEETRKVGK